jgi:hypothetical protein
MPQLSGAIGMSMEKFSRGDFIVSINCQIDWFMERDDDEFPELPKDALWEFSTCIQLHVENIEEVHAGTDE